MRLNDKLVVFVVFLLLTNVNWIIEIDQIKSFITVLRRSMYRVGGTSLRVIAPWQHNPFWRNVATVASCWHHYIRFNRPEIWTSDLPLQWRTRYRSTYWPVLKLKWIHKQYIQQIETQWKHKMTNKTLEQGSATFWTSGPQSVLTRFQRAAIIPADQKR